MIQSKRSSIAALDIGETSECQNTGFFMLDHCYPFFPQVPGDWAQSDKWRDVFSAHMTHPEHIALLEGRGMVAAFKHKLKSKVEHGRDQEAVSIEAELRIW